MEEISFNFQEYIATRKGEDEALAQSGSAYGYPGDHRILRALARVTPVTLAVEATARLWKGAARTEILGQAVKVTEKEHPEIYRNAVHCADRLHLSLPTLYVAPGVPGLTAHTFGSNEDAHLVLGAALVEGLRAEELRFIIGHELGHVQGGHVVYMTALYYLTCSANQYVRWIVKPAVMALESWTRRAEVTCDRAGLICSGELAPSVAAVTRLALRGRELSTGLDFEGYLRQLEGGGTATGPVAELIAGHPQLPLRVEALRLFAETHFFLKASGRRPREDEGKSLAWCDARVKQLLPVFRGRREAKEKD